MKNKDAKATINNDGASNNLVRGQLSVIYTVISWFCGSMETHFLNCMIENLNTRYGHDIPLKQEQENQTEYLTRVVNHLKNIDCGVINELIINRY